MKRPRSRVARLGPLPETVDFDLVADIYLAETRHPAPAALDHHDDAGAASPVAVAMAVAVIAATHSTTTFAATAGGSCGRNERGGALMATAGCGRACAASRCC